MGRSRRARMRRCRPRRSAISEAEAEDADAVDAAVAAAVAGRDGVATRGLRRRRAHHEHARDASMTLAVF